MPSVPALIDRCADLCGSQSALARRLGVTHGRVNDWRHGRRQLTAATLAALADLAQIDGAEARRLLAEIETAKAPTPELAQLMRRAFFAVWVTGVGALCGAPTTTDAAPAMSPRGLRLLSVLSVDTLSALLRVWITATRAGFPGRAASI